MRFRMRHVVLFLSTIYVLYLAVNGSLALYIHPRYVIFTIVMSLVGILLTVFDVVMYERDDKHSHGFKLSYIPLTILLLVAILLPARTLTSSTVTQRSIDTRPVIPASTGSLSSTFSGSSRGLDILDWARLLTTNTESSYYQNKPAKISGFIYDAGLGEDTVWLARFVLSCCAVDAQPVVVPVQISDWKNNYQEDEWIEVEGQFELREPNGGKQLVLVPELITKIEQPSNPYAN